MIEQGIYFALGCIITALLALLFAPVFWRRALRLTRQRLALQVPLSMQEILAQRDQIRAEYAVERLRIEQAMDKVQATKAADMAEIGRRSMEAATLREEVSGLRGAQQAQQADIERLQREAAEAAARTPENVAASERPDAEAAPVPIDPMQMDRMQIEIDSLRATVASLKTRGMGLEAQLKDAQRDRGQAETDASLRARLETAMSHVARHEGASLSIRRELDDAKTHIRRLEQQLEATKSTSNGAADEMQRRASPAAEHDVELLIAENAALKGALAVVPRDSAASMPDDAGLRETIHSLGLAVAKLTRLARERDETDKKLPRVPVAEPVAHPLGVG